MDNNMSSYASFIRDTFLEAEGDYARQIQQEKKASIETLTEVDGAILADAAKHFMDLVEYGCVDYEAMEQLEIELIKLVSAIKDVTLRRELVLTPDFQEEYEHTLSRGRRCR